MNKSHLLINEPALQVLPSLAKSIGLEEAIILQQLHYWLNNSKVEGRIEEGEKWIYNSYQEWQDNFPFWSVQQIQRIFLNLEKGGVVISAKLDAKKHDQTKFYRIDYDALCAMEHIKFDSSKVSESNDVNKELHRLPENKDINLSEKDLEQVNAKFDYIIQNSKKASGFSIQCESFEIALFGNIVSWPWDSNSKWQKFAKWVAAQDSALFVQYAEWRKADGKFHAMSNNKIRQDPQMFMDTGWPTFLAHVSMYKPKDKGFAL